MLPANPNAYPLYLNSFPTAMIVAVNLPTQLPVLCLSSSVDAPLPLMFIKVCEELLLLLPPPTPNVDCSLSVNPWILSTKLCFGSGVGATAISMSVFRLPSEPLVCDVTGAQAAVLLMAAIWFSALLGI